MWRSYQIGGCSCIMKQNSLSLSDTMSASSPPLFLFEFPASVSLTGHHVSHDKTHVFSFCFFWGGRGYFLLFSYVLFSAGEKGMLEYVLDNRVFPKVDHSANIVKIVLVEYAIRSVVESNFC